MNHADEQVKAFLDEISEKRGMENFYDRFEPDYVISGGVKLHLDVIEVDVKRPTIVFMPGTNAYAILYGEFLTALADKGYNIVGFDPRGHGRSEGARGSYVMPELMADMRAAIRYARKRFGDPVVVSGSSQGGMTSFYIAAEGFPVAGAIMSQHSRPRRPLERRAYGQPHIKPVRQALYYVLVTFFSRVKSSHDILYRPEK